MDGGTWAGGSANGGPVRRPRRGCKHDLEVAMADEAVLERVRKLLAKAEGTSYEAEAEAFFAKAQELMQSHAITEAMLARKRGSDEKPILLSVTIPAPYATNKASLLHQVAVANRCRTVMERLPGTGGMVEVGLFGFADDAEYVQALWTSLMVHAVGEMMKLGEGGRTVEIRRSFLIGYSVRIGERLREANRAVMETADQNSGESTSLALLDREAQVEELLRARYPYLRRVRSSVSHAESYRAGRAAGGSADLGGAKLGGQRSALSR
jgi:Protein of unknown function (DUF2786)